MQIPSGDVTTTSSIRAYRSSDEEHPSEDGGGEGPADPIVAHLLVRNDSQVICNADSASNVPLENENISFWRMDRRGKIVLAVISLATYTESAAFSCLAPFFPVEADKKQMTSFEVAFLIGIYELVIFLLSPLFGKFLSHFGAKFLFNMGIIVCGYCAILFGVLEYCPAGTSFISTSFATRITEAAGAAAYLTASFAIIAHEFPNQVSTVFGTVEMFGGLGFLTGPLLGSAFYELGGFKLPFVVLGCIVIMTGLFAWRFLPAKLDTERTEDISVWNLFKSPMVLLASLSIFSAFSSMGFLTANFGQRLNEQNLPPYAIGLIFAVPSISYTISAPLVGIISDKLSFGIPLMTIGCLINVASFLIVGPAPFLIKQPQLWSNIVGALLLGMGLSGCGIPPFDLCLKSAVERGYPDNFDTYGLVSGLINSVIAISVFLGSALGGLAVEYIGFEWTTTAAAALTLSTGIIIGVTVILLRFRRQTDVN